MEIICCFLARDGQKAIIMYILLRSYDRQYSVLSQILRVSGGGGGGEVI